MKRVVSFLIILFFICSQKGFFYRTLLSNKSYISINSNGIHSFVIINDIKDFDINMSEISTTRHSLPNSMIKNDKIDNSFSYSDVFFLYYDELLSCEIVILCFKLDDTNYSDAKKAFIESDWNKEKKSNDYTFFFSEDKHKNNMCRGYSDTNKSIIFLSIDDSTSFSFYDDFEYGLEEYILKYFNFNDF